MELHPAFSHTAVPEAMIKVALAIATFDGIEGLYCGVGSVTQYMLAALPQLSQEFAAQGIQLSTHVLYSSVPSHLSRSPEIARRTELMRNAASIELVSLEHGESVPNPFGTWRTWPVTCQHAAAHIRTLARTHDRVLVLALDTPFAGLPRLLCSDDDARKIRIAWIAESTGRIWARDESASDARREDWERRAVDDASDYDNVFLGAISDYMAEHLVTDWEAPPDRILPFTCGVSLSYLERFERRETSSLAETLKKASIPTDVPLFLSFARAQWYKGLDLAAELGVALASRFDVHPVVLALDDGTDNMAEQLSRIRSVLEAQDHSAFTLLSHYPTLLPRWLMQWPLCRGVAVMSRREPFGLIPSEYRVLGPSDGLLVTSDAGGLLEQTRFEDEGLILRLNSQSGLDTSSVEKVFERWTAAPGGGNQKGRQRVEEDYRMERNLLEGLQGLL